MSSVERLVSQLHHTYRGPSWHGPTLFELLADVSSVEALEKPLPGSHSIWEIVLHSAAWKRAVKRRVDGEPVRLDGAADWPEVSGDSDRAWRDALADLDAAHVALEARVRKLEESDLDNPSPTDRDVSIYATLHGVIQHDIYHAGQIALLKKAVRAH
jgi:uncharacterized damage-inducible protein DinB